MKNAIIATAILFATATASAASIQVEGGRGSGSNVGFVAVTEKVLGVDAQIGYTNQLSKGPRSDSISVGASRDLFTYANTTVAAYAGVQYGRTGVAGSKVGKTNEGFGITYGVGASYPLTAKVDLIADFRRTEAQSRVKEQTGNTTYAGVSVKF